MNVTRHQHLLACRRYVLDALTAEMRRRSLDDDGWIERERVAVADAATRWGTAMGYPCEISAADIERIEHRAMGHVDYASKLAIYTAELVVT